MPSTVNDSARAMMAAVKSWYNQIAAGTISTGTVGGTADAITLTCSPTVETLATGQRFAFKYTSTGNTTAVTLNVDGLGATALRYKDVALVAGDIATSDWVLCVYDGTRFQMLNPPRLSWATTDIPTDTTGGAVGDLFLFADASESNALNKVTLQKMLDNALTGLTADTAPDVADSVLTYDASATAAKTTTITNFYKTINALTEDATPDVSNDFVVTYDASATSAKKAKPINLSPIASAAQMAAASSNTVYVTPGRVISHPGVAKASASISFSGSTQTNQNTYGLTSATDAGVGLITFTFSTAFTTAYYICSGMCQRVSGNDALWPAIRNAGSHTPSTTSVTTATVSDGAATSDPTLTQVAFFGTQ